MMEVRVTTVAKRCAMLQSNCYHQQAPYRLDELPVAQPTLSDAMTAAK